VPNLRVAADEKTDANLKVQPAGFIAKFTATIHNFGNLTVSGLGCLISRPLAIVSEAKRFAVSFFRPSHLLACSPAPLSRPPLLLFSTLMQLKN
jgi:hypothetical protein